MKNAIKGLTFTLAETGNQEVDRNNAEIVKTVASIEQTLEGLIAISGTCELMLQQLRANQEINKDHKALLEGLFVKIIDEISPQAQAAKDLMSTKVDAEALLRALDTLNDLLADYTLAVNDLDKHLSNVALKGLFAAIGAHSTDQQGAIRQPNTAQLRICGNLIPDLKKYIDRDQENRGATIARHASYFFKGMRERNMVVQKTIESAKKEDRINSLRVEGNNIEYHLGEGFRAAAKRFCREFNGKKINLEVQTHKPGRRFLGSTSRDYIFSREGENLFTVHIRRTGFSIENHRDLTLDEFANQLFIINGLIEAIRTCEEVAMPIRLRLPASINEYQSYIEYVKEMEIMHESLSESSSSTFDNEDVVGEIRFIEEADLVKLTSETIDPYARTVAQKRDMLEKMLDVNMFAPRQGLR